MKKTFPLNAALCIIGVLSVIFAPFILVSCNKPNLKKACDLIFVRVNNVTAEWDGGNPNACGDCPKKLNVTVPYTEFLAITDAVASTGKQIGFYSDVGFSRPIQNIKAIPISNARSIYIRVTDKRARKRVSEYELRVNVKRCLFPRLADESARNQGGHEVIPDGIDQVDLDGRSFTVVRSYEDAAKAVRAGVDCIQACDIEGDGNGKSLFCDKVYNGIFDGNNYAITLTNAPEGVFPAVGKAGVLRNIMLKSSSDKVSARCGLADLFLGRAENCANYISFSSTGEREFCAGIANGADEGGSGYAKGCVNYGDIFSSSRSCSGIIGRGEAVNCYNVGDISGKKYAAGICLRAVGAVENCSNMGIISGGTGAGGLVAIAYKRVEYGVNYGKICADGGGRPVRKGKTGFGGVVGIAEGCEPEKCVSYF